MSQRRLPLSPTLPNRQSPARWPADRDGLMRAFLIGGDGRRFTASGLAREAGVSERVIYDTRHGRTRCTLEVGLKIARALGRSPWWIVDYTKRIRALGRSVRPTMKWNRKPSVWLDRGGSG